MGALKDATQQYTFRIPVDLKAEMERIATEEDRSLSKQIIVALRTFVKENAKGK
jgi:predicted transcriptional regulator